MTKFLFIILIFTTFGVNAQTDSTKTFKNKWNKFKEKAKEKTDELKTSIEKSKEEKNHNKPKNTENKTIKSSGPVFSEIGANQHIEAKDFPEGPQSYKKVVNGEWEKYDFTLKVKKEYAENGDVRVISTGYAYKMAFEYNGGINKKYLNTHFYSKEKSKYGVYYKGSFINYKYEGSGKNLTVIDIGVTGGDLNISPSKLIKILIQHKYFIEAEKDKVAANKYESISNFQENNWRIVGNEGKFGYINEKDELIVPIDYNKIMNFSEGFSWVEKKSKWFLLDSNGKIDNINQFDVVTNFKNGKASVKEGNKIGFINKTKEVEWIFTKGEYDIIYDAGKAFVTTKGDYQGLITHTGKTLLPCEYKINREHYLKDGLLIITGKDDLVGYYKIGYGWITERIYSHAKIASSKYYIDIVNIESSTPYYIHGFVSLDGTIEWQDEFKRKTPPNKYPNKEKLPWRNQYKTGYRVIEDHAIAVRSIQKGKSGVIDYDGTIIIESKYYTVWDVYPEYYLFTEHEKAIKYDIIGNTYSKPIEIIDKAYRKRLDDYAAKYSGGKSNYSNSSSSSKNSTSSSSTSIKMVQVNINPNGKGKNFVHIHWSENGSQKKKTFQTKSSGTLGSVPEGTKLYYSIDNSTKKIFFFDVPKGKSSASVKIN